MHTPSVHLVGFPALLDCALRVTRATRNLGYCVRRREEHAVSAAAVFAQGTVETYSPDHERKVRDATADLLAERHCLRKVAEQGLIAVDAAILLGARPEGLCKLELQRRIPGTESLHWKTVAYVPAYYWPSEVDDIVTPLSFVHDAYDARIVPFEV